MKNYILPTNIVINFVYFSYVTCNLKTFLNFIHRVNTWIEYNGVTLFFIHEVFKLKKSEACHLDSLSTYFIFVIVGSEIV